MKKVLCIILSAVLLLSLVIIPASAAADDYIPDDLLQRLENMNDTDRVRVTAYFKTRYPSSADVFAETETVIAELDSLGETYDRRAVYIETWIRMAKARLNEQMDKYGLTFGDILSKNKWDDETFFAEHNKGNPIKLDLFITKAQVYRIAEIGEETGDLSTSTSYPFYYISRNKGIIRTGEFVPYEVPENIEDKFIGKQETYNTLLGMPGSEVIYCLIQACNPDYTPLNELERQAAVICGYDSVTAQSKEEYTNYWACCDNLFAEDTLRAENALKQKLDNAIGRQVYVDEEGATYIQPIQSAKYLTVEEFLRIAELDEIAEVWYIGSNPPTYPTFDPNDPQYEPPTTPFYQNGDANKDGKVDVNDVTHIQKIVARYDGYNYVETADLDGDGKITIIDATRLQKQLASAG